MGWGAHDVTVTLLTENVDITELCWDFSQKRGDLVFVRNVERDGDEMSALLNACCLVCGSTSLCYDSQGIRSACSENDIRTTLSGESACVSVTDKS